MTKHNQPAKSRGNSADAADTKSATPEAVAAAPEPKAPEAVKPEPSKPIKDVDVADSKLRNDPLACYDNVDVDELQKKAIQALNESGKLDRKEGQMQIANILARYHQGKFAADQGPTKLYNSITGSLDVKVVQSIARSVYEVPEKVKNAKGREVPNKLPRNLEMRIRNIAPVLHFAATDRIPLRWDASHGCLLVPLWFVTTDTNIIEEITNDPTGMAKAKYSNPVKLDGKNGATVQLLIKRSPKSQPQDERTDAQKKKDEETAAKKAELKETEAVTEVVRKSLVKALAIVLDAVSKAPEGDQLSDEIVEHVQAICEQVMKRNGEDALGKAAKAMLSKKTT